MKARKMDLTQDLLKELFDYKDGQLLCLTAVQERG
jgi:hypothetical protein